RPDLARGVVRAAQAVLDEAAEDLLGACAIRPGHVRAADARRRQRALQAVSREVVQLLKLLRRAAPVADVRLVPDFPVPTGDLGPAVLRHRVLRPLVDEVAPFP